MVGVAIFDLDHFQQVNDDHGHTTGDRILRLFVDVAETELRAGDVFARYGGEEFVALFVGAKRENIIVVAERARSAVAEASIEVDGKELSTTVSVGISFFAGEESELAPVLQRADRALYEAKKDRRNRYVVAVHA